MRIKFLACVQNLLEDLLFFEVSMFAENSLSNNLLRLLQVLDDLVNLKENIHTLSFMYVIRFAQRFAKSPRGQGHRSRFCIFSFRTYNRWVGADLTYSFFCEFLSVHNAAGTFCDLWRRIPVCAAAPFKSASNDVLCTPLANQHLLLMSHF